MNKRHWQILTLGTLAAVLVSSLGTTWHRPPVAGPRVDHATGYYSQNFTDAVTPKWALLVSLSLAELTAAAVYKHHTQASPPDHERQEG